MNTVFRTTVEDMLSRLATIPSEIEAHKAKCDENIAAARARRDEDITALETEAKFLRRALAIATGGEAGETEPVPSAEG